jgi:hypothetical protein
MCCSCGFNELCAWYNETEGLCGSTMQIQCGSVLAYSGTAGTVHIHLYTTRRVYASGRIAGELLSVRSWADVWACSNHKGHALPLALGLYVMYNKSLPEDIRIGFIS